MLSAKEQERILPKIWQLMELETAVFKLNEDAKTLWDLCCSKNKGQFNYVSLFFYYSKAVHYIKNLENYAFVYDHQKEHFQNLLNFFMEIDSAFQAIFSAHKDEITNRLKNVIESHVSVISKTDVLAAEIKELGSKIALRERIAYILLYVRSKQAGEEKQYLEIDVDTNERILKIADFSLRKLFLEQAQSSGYEEKAAYAPEEFWWRHMPGFVFDSAGFLAQMTQDQTDPKEEKKKTQEAKTAKKKSKTKVAQAPADKVTKKPKKIAAKTVLPLTELERAQNFLTSCKLVKKIRRHFSFELIQADKSYLLKIGRPDWKRYLRLMLRKETFEAMLQNQINSYLGKILNTFSEFVAEWQKAKRKGKAYDQWLCEYIGEALCFPEHNTLILCQNGQVLLLRLWPAKEFVSAIDLLRSKRKTKELPYQLSKNKQGQTVCLVEDEIPLESLEKFRLGDMEPLKDCLRLLLWQIK